jgi:hypothetical protein
MYINSRQHFYRVYLTASNKEELEDYAHKRE